MRNGFLWLSLIATPLGCSKPERTVNAVVHRTENPVPPREVFNTGIAISGLPDAHECKVVGAIREDRLGMLIWDVPGKVAFDVVISCDKPIDVKKLRTSLYIGPEGSRVRCGSGSPVAELKNGQLHLTVEQTVLAAFDTKNLAMLQINEFIEGHFVEIGRIPFSLKFVQAK